MQAPAGARSVRQLLDASWEDEKSQLLSMLQQHLQLDFESATYYFDTLFEELDCALNCGDPYMAYYCTSAEIRKVTSQTQFGNFSTSKQFGMELSIDLELVIQDFKDIIGNSDIGMPQFTVDQEGAEAPNDTDVFKLADNIASKGNNGLVKEEANDNIISTVAP